MIDLTSLDELIAEGAKWGFILPSDEELRISDPAAGKRRKVRRLQSQLNQLHARKVDALLTSLNGEWPDAFLELKAGLAPHVSGEFLPGVLFACIRLAAKWYEKGRRAHGHTKAWAGLLKAHLRGQVERARLRSALVRVPESAKRPAESNGESARDDGLPRVRLAGDRDTEIQDRAQGPDEEAAALDLIEYALEPLTKIERMCLRLWYENELPRREIAERVGIPEYEVLPTINRALDIAQEKGRIMSSGKARPMEVPQSATRAKARFKQ
jgi:hypothetical protein